MRESSRSIIPTVEYSTTCGMHSWACPSEDGLLRAASRVGRSADPRLPKNLEECDWDAIRRRTSELRILENSTQELRARFFVEHGILKVAKAEAEAFLANLDRAIQARRMEVLYQVPPSRFIEDDLTDSIGLKTHNIIQELSRRLKKPSISLRESVSGSETVTLS